MCSVSSRLLVASDLFECNSSCSCGIECTNRVTQHGSYNRKKLFYLFKTPQMM